MRELIVRRGGVRLDVRTTGRGRRHLILIHGLASTKHIWDLVEPLLEDEFRVTSYDQRGHGGSSRPSSYSFEAVCADLAAVAEEVGARRPILVGHSYGANVAIDYATRSPRDVAGVVCVDGGMGSMAEFMTWQQVREELAPPDLSGVRIGEIVAMMREKLGRRWRPETEHIVRSLFFIDSRDKITPCLSRGNHMRILKAMYDQRPKELLARITVPTLMYCARPRPHVLDEERGFYEMKKNAVGIIRRSNPIVRIEWIRSIHDIPIDRPVDLARRIARFARREASKPAAGATRRARRPRSGPARRASRR